MNLPSDGDAIYFNALFPHRLRSVGNTPASALVVISAGNSDDLAFPSGVGALVESLGAHTLM